MFADNQYAFDSKGRKFSANSMASLADESSQVLWEEINPGNAVKGTVYFDVPKGGKLTSLDCMTGCSPAASTSISEIASGMPAWARKVPTRHTAPSRANTKKVASVALSAIQVLAGATPRSPPSGAGVTPAAPISSRW
jgi:hypothetical protein